MANALINLLVKLGLDAKGFTDGLDDAEKKSTGAGKAINEGLSKIGGAVVMGGIAAVGAGAVAMGAYLREAIPAASDLNETVSKVGVVFGKYSVQMTEWGKTGATSLGMSQNEALTAAGTFGNLFKAMKIGEPATMDMSKGLVQLGSDLASFNNMDPVEVMDKLRAGISGETEPLKSLGVNISAAAIETKALAMGFKKVNGELTPAAKAQASYALIMEQTTTAQGDFARTSDGLANQQRIAAAQWKDLQAKIGQAFLPTVIKLVDWFTTNMPKMIEVMQPVIDKIPAMLDTLVLAFQNAFGWLMNNQGVIVAVLAVIGAAIAVWAWGAIVAITPVVIAMLPLILTIAAIGLAAYLLYQAWTNNWGGIQQIMAGVWAWLQPILQNVWNWLQVAIPAALAWLSNAWTTVLLPAILSVWGWIQANVFPLFVKLFDWLQVQIPVALAWLSNVWTNTLLPAITAVWSWIQTYLVPLFTSFSNFIKAEFSLGITNFTRLWDTTLLPALKSVWQFVNDKIFPLFKEFTDWISKNIGPVFENVGKIITETFGKALHGIEDSIRWIQTMLDKAKGQADSANGKGSGTVTPDRHRANGGPVMADVPYWVGERGPELFYPRTSGTIVPNGVSQALAGNSTSTTTNSRVTQITVNPHYYRGDEPTLLQELSQINAMVGA